MSVLSIYHYRPEERNDELMKPIRNYRDMMTEHGEEPLFRIPVDLGTGCPHRDLDGRGGCTFCPEHGSRAMQIMPCKSIEEQVATAIIFARNRYRAKRFMLYCQAFSSTLNLDDEMKALYRRILGMHPFDAMSIGTRPDCLGDDVLDFLQELQEETDLWIELGVQTIHDATLRHIHREHDWATSRAAIERLHARNIKTIVHVILGLPGETQEQMEQSADQLAGLPLDGIKIHNLHVIRGTRMADEYREDPFPVYNEYDYAEMLMGFLRHIPYSLPVMRLCTDTAADDLLAPVWSMSKCAFLEYVQRQMIKREWMQGDRCARKLNRMEGTELIVKPVTTEDGSLTFWNEEYKEHYHTPMGARLEAEEKYVRPSNLEKRLVKADVQLLDICFGLGYNSLCACETAEKIRAHRLEVTALEMDRRVVGKAAHALSSRVLQKLHDHGQVHETYFNINMRWGDARHTIQGLRDHWYDIVFLDAFSTQRNSELWTQDFFEQILRVIHPTGVLLTYCAALPVRAGLIKAGFYVGETEPVGRKRSGTIASRDPDSLSFSLSPKEMHLLQTTERGRPYRDPTLCRSNKEILRTRQEEIKRDDR